VTLPVVWMAEATGELLEARSWYATIRPELGERFAAVYRGLRRAGVRRFPYGLIFEVQERQILVLACFHGKRDPRQWKSRTSG
jgi:plasmid stabilization system protein ParE